MTYTPCACVNCVTQVTVDPAVRGDISKVRIEHDSRLPGKGWRPDKARILILILRKYFVQINLSSFNCEQCRLPSNNMLKFITSIFQPDSRVNKI